MAAHRYWRIRVTATGGGSVVNIGDIELRSSAGGADETGMFNAENGAAVASSQAAGFEAKFAFSGATSDSWKSTAIPAHIAYDLNYFFGGNEKDIVEFVISAPDSGFADAPTDFVLEHSDDGVSYTVAKTVSGEGAWSTGESRVYSVSGAVSTGITSLNLQHVVYQTGIASLALLHVVYQTGAASLTVQHNPVDPSGVSTLHLRHVVKQYGAASLTVQHVPAYPSGTAALTLKHQIIATGTSSLTLVHRPNSGSTGDFWQALIMLDGVDVSSQITGAIDIDAEAGAARVAYFIMKPTTGVIDSQGWVKKPVTIDYQTYSGGVLQTHHRRFTGFVSDATYDPLTKLTHFECSDLLQESFEGVDRSFIDSVIGGYYSDAIFNETESGWEYAQQRLESQPYFYDKDANGVGRKWAKQGGIVSKTFDQSSIIDDSLVLSMATARDIINTVEIEFNYRLPRKWQREISVAWTFPQSFSEFLGQSQIRMPNKNMFLSALGSGWWVKSVSFGETPESGSIGGTNWINHPEYELILSASAIVATRWNQDITEQYTLTIKSDASIDKFGEIKETEKYSLEAPEEEEHEEALKSRSSVSITSSTNSSTATSPDYKSPESGSTALGNGDYYLDGSSRTDFENAIQTAIAVGKADILNSHQRNEVSFEAMIDPDLDIGLTLGVNAGGLTSEGILTALNEHLDLNSGAAIAAVTLSVYAPNISGQADDVISVPALPDITPPTESPDVTLANHVGGAKTVRDHSGGIDVVSYAKTPADPLWRGLLTNYTATLGVPADAQFYPFEFRIELPAVESTLRAAQTFNVESTINVAIPQQTLTITV